MTNQPNNWEEEFEKQFNNIIGRSFECVDAEKTLLDIKSFLKSELQKQADRYEGIIREMVSIEARFAVKSKDYTNGFNEKRERLIQIAKSHNIDFE